MPKRSPVRLLAPAIFLVAALPAIGTAQDEPPFDVPLSYAKLKITSDGAGGGKLVFSMKDPFFIYPTLDSAYRADPSRYGAEIRILGAGGYDQKAFSVPYGNLWLTRDYPDPPFLFRNREAPDSVSSIRGISIKNGSGIKISAPVAGLNLGGTTGPSGVRIVIGDYRFCAHFDEADILDDKERSYRAYSTTTPVDCDDETLAGVTVSVCGDHLLGDAEDCDGAKCERADVSNYSCVIPGAPDECTCCSNSSSRLPCCQPSVEIWTGGIGTRWCIPKSCEPPFTCRENDTCLPDGTCCSGIGSDCGLEFLGIDQDGLGCCEGTICDRLLQLGVFTPRKCCIASGNACTQNSDCCSSDCEVGGVCAGCAPAGAPCGLTTPCCSGSCGTDALCLP